MNSERPIRILWLGAHKILVKTELPRLRQLGFEVFCPRYKSDNVLHQSATSGWTHDQPSTLSRDVFDRLSDYDFFNAPIAAEMASLVEQHFDVVMVMIDWSLLNRVLTVFKKKVLFRSYGHVCQMTAAMWAAGEARAILNADNFWHVPHSAEIGASEHLWLREREVVIPYVPPDDVFLIRDQWDVSTPKNGEIMLMCPNIANPYYEAHYRYLRAEFKDPQYQYYGVQQAGEKRAGLVGTLTSEEYRQRFLQASGFLYTYRDPTVCFLPPIEMMIAGGPVLFLSGSLLDRYFHGDSPGRCNDESEARAKAERLRQGDREFARAIIQAQEAVRARYLPEVVWPIFDTEISRLLSPQTTNVASHAIVDVSKPSVAAGGRDRVYVFCHAGGPIFKYSGGAYQTPEGVFRVARQLVRALLEKLDCEIVVTSNYDHFQETYGFFRSLPGGERVKVLLVDRQEPVVAVQAPRQRDFKSVVNRAKGFVKRRFSHTSWVFRALLFALRKLRQLKSSVSKPEIAAHLLAARHPGESHPCPPHIGFINADPRSKVVLVPHYHLYPEAVGLEKSYLLYLPDYFPHFWKTPEEFDPNQLTYEAIGQKVVKRASAILTNSHFSKDYLPKSSLAVDQSKIDVIFLPDLNMNEVASDSGFDMELAMIRQQLGEAKFVFYPTQFRTNKNLPFLLEVFAEYLRIDPSLVLVLTCQEALLAPFLSGAMRKHVRFFFGLSDAALRHLYRTSECLCFTSGLEGNFPPQVFEALVHDCPVIATRLPLIEERLGSHSDSLLLCREKNVADFVAAFQRVRLQRREVLARQKLALEILLQQSSWDHFSQNVENLFSPFL